MATSIHSCIIGKQSLQFCAEDTGRVQVLTLIGLEQSGVFPVIPFKRNIRVIFPITYFIFHMEHNYQFDRLTADGNKSQKIAYQIAVYDQPIFHLHPFVQMKGRVSFGGYDSAQQRLKYASYANIGTSLSVIHVICYFITYLVWTNRLFC